MSLREVGKARRRGRILRAARRLIESGGAESIALKPVADAAELSLATLYNLFGSKEGVLIALLLESIQSFEERLSKLAPTRPVDRLAAIADLAVAEFTAHERFYRSLFHSIEQMGSRTQLLAVIRRCVDLGHESIAQAIEAGDLEPLVEPRVLAHQIFMAFVHALRTWSSGGSSSDLFAAQVAHFRSVMLAAVAHEPLRSELRRKLRALNAPMRALADLGREACELEAAMPPRRIQRGARR